jgi:hypothetical protein
METILYTDAARSYAAKANRPVNEHVINVIASVMMTRDNVLQGGHFAQAVVNNNLRDAVSRADEDVLRELKLIVMASNNAFLDDLI